MSRRLAVSVASGCLLVLCGCGGSERRSRNGSRLTPAAEPANAPLTTTAPAGNLVHVGGMPEGIVADSRTHLVAVGLREPAELALIDARSGRLVRRVPIPGAPRHLQLAARGGPVLVPAETANELVEVPLPDGPIATTRTLRQPHDATAVDGRIFVGNEFGGSVSVLSHGRTVASIGGLTQPGGVAADGDRLAVIDVRSNLLSLYDARTLELLGRAPAGRGPTHVVSDGRDRLYVADTRGDAIDVFGASSSGVRLLARIALPGTPYGIALDPRRRRLWVTLTARDQLVELSVRRSIPSRIALYATARQPNTVAVEESDGRVFVADRLAGDVQIIDPAR